MRWELSEVVVFVVAFPEKSIVGFLALHLVYGLFALDEDQRPLSTVEIGLFPPNILMLPFDCRLAVQRQLYDVKSFQPAGSTMRDLFLLHFCSVGVF